MYQSDIGPLDGDTWEGLIQAVFKKKYDSYQEMVASPGDLGIEGFVLNEGILIQCYCPDENYDSKTLYEKQRDKLTKDIGKLISNEKALEGYFGDSIIHQWIFITPRIAKHEIHAHARIKEQEIIDAKLSFIAPDFRILVKDLGAYQKEITYQQQLDTGCLRFSEYNGENISKPELKTDYDKNIVEKNLVRSKVKNVYKPQIHEMLNAKTKKHYLEGYGIFDTIFVRSPESYQRIAKIINNFEDDVEIMSSMWEDKPQSLIEKVEAMLIERLKMDPHVSLIQHEDLALISRHMVAKWIAECPMRIEE
ncbi:hypothetical protein ACPF3S_003304 [Vibrio cholerae]|uniref:hypothetical protein n=1 Tax=Vibrio cholerae TaxID=666 RepID=UPI000E6B644C|nr:hypothetical protein [Vibrio cholerae]EGQ8672665.1 hypothetical protein [Vibrio cholerae]EGQ9463909.1 hypothetical protein [Vibrio cholerae]EGR1090350.1 hypothetical protein [Vibrio cholerae]EGR1330177.1 hypothetical protein [Vibrio cholerae]EGR1447998.1 hypothetical protein [Vibrio cholerae]